MRETVPITAEWALWGRYAGGSGYQPRELYRLLECSDGPVRREAFEQALLRYSPGKLEDRPQVTVSWLPVQAGQSYMAIAIHARPEIGWGDAAGRESTVTRYYCAPFSDLAAGTVSYQAMYEG